MSKKATVAEAAKFVARFAGNVFVLPDDAFAFLAMADRIEAGACERIDRLCDITERSRDARLCRRCDSVCGDLVGIRTTIREAIARVAGRMNEARQLKEAT